jgi:hypothetical protein
MSVIPTKVGIQSIQNRWIPAFAGMTVGNYGQEIDEG